MAIPDVGALLQIYKPQKGSKVEGMYTEDLPSKVKGVYTEDLPSRVEGIYTEDLPSKVEGMYTEDLPSKVEGMYTEDLPLRVEGMYTEGLLTLRDANTVANLAAMVDTSALYCAEPSEFSPNRVCRLLPSSVVKVRLSIVSSSTFTCDKFDDTNLRFRLWPWRLCAWRSA